MYIYIYIYIYILVWVTVAPVFHIREIIDIPC